MDQGTVFNSSQPQNPDINQTPIAPSNPSQIPPISQPPPPPPPESEGLIPRLLGSKIFKIVLGIFILLFILIIIFSVILPRFSSKEEEKVTLTYWGLWEDAQTMQSITSDFNRLNPNITVTYSKQDPKDYRQRILTRIANDSGPDVFRFHNSWYPMLSQVLLPIPEAVLSKDEFTKRYYEIAQKDLVKNGAIIGIPLEIDNLSLFINYDLFKSAGLEPPTTWEEFRNRAKSMTVKDESGKIKTSGAALGTYENVTHAPDIMSLLFVQNGADLNSITTSQKQVEDALRFYTSFAKGDGGVWDPTLDSSALAFAKGNLAMFFGYSWDYFNIKAINPNLNFQIVPVPQLDSANKSTIGSYWAEGVSVKTKHQKEALAFMKYLASPQAQEKLFAEQSKTRLFGEPYSNINLASKLKTHPNLSTIVAQAPYSASSYFVDSTYDGGLNSKLNTYLGNAINSTLNNSSPESATAALFSGVTQVLKEYGQ